MNNAKNTTLSPYLERLLDGEDVEWKTLGEVCDILRGKRLTKKELSEEGKYAVFHGGLVPIGFYSESNRKGDTTMVINVGASAGTIGYSRDDFWSSDGCFCISPSPFLLSRFIFYVLQSKDFQIKGKVRIAGIPTLDINVLEQFPIPIPPLRVQARIVEILDKFTQLEAELEKELAAELEARKKQYAYYRDQLLNFSQYPPLNVNIEWKTLGEVCESICSGGTPSTEKKQYYQGSIPWLRTQDIDWREVYDTEIKITEEAIANSSAKLIPANCVIVAMYGATAAKACINKIPLTTNQACCNLQVDEKVAHYKYVYYWISNEYERLKAQGEGSQSNLNARKIKSYKIPLPPLSEQRRIVDILDRFDTLTNSISEGLPKEIDLRRKQYAYYRDALLSFPHPEVSA
ncbi:MAG: restriction endonuclease subunit S [Prevotellaceae bacterium]|nr:restriction endonuclease subunit S [Prevotellaceae bacterium]